MGRGQQVANEARAYMDRMKTAGRSTGGRGLHWSTFRLDVSTFCGIPWDTRPLFGLTRASLG